MTDHILDYGPLTYGESHPLYPSIGSASFSVSLPGLPISGSYTYPYDGEQYLDGHSSLTWGNSFIGIDSEAESWNWSIPMGPISIGETYAHDGTYLNFGINILPGVEASFAAHEDNPETNMQAGARSFDLLDADGNIIGQERYVPVGSAQTGWAYHISRVDLQGNPIGETRIVPMPIQNQQFYASSGLTGNCFLFDTTVQLWTESEPAKNRSVESASFDGEILGRRVAQKPIGEIEVDDFVVSYDSAGNITKGRVTRTFVNEVAIVLDVFGLMVTPGHSTFCGEGKFAGQHVPIIDILRSDGALMNVGGDLIRAATGFPLGSDEDQFITAITAEALPNGKFCVEASARIRAGTSVRLENGDDITVLDLIHANGGTVDADGLVIRDGSAAPMPFLWPFGSKLPNPEDYVLDRSGVTLSEIFDADEWEATGPRLAHPDASTLV